MTYRRCPSDVTALEFIKHNYVALLDITVKMINSQNFFAQKEALKLINAIVREEYLVNVKEAFISSTVCLVCKRLELSKVSNDSSTG